MYRVTWKKVASAVLIGFLGLIVNLFPLSLGYGLYLLPGLIVGYLALLVFGLPLALVTTTIAMAPGLLYWGFSLIPLVALGELACVAFVLHRYRMQLPAAVALFWVLLGIPMGVLLQFFSPELAGITLALLVIKLSVNSVVAASVAALLVLGASSIRWVPEPVWSVVYSMRAVMLNVLIVFVLMPLVLFEISQGHFIRQNIDQRVQNRLESALDVVSPEPGGLTARQLQRLDRIGALVSERLGEGEMDPGILDAGERRMAQTDGLADVGVVLADGQEGGRILPLWGAVPFLDPAAIAGPEAGRAGVASVPAMFRLTGDPMSHSLVLSRPLSSPGHGQVFVYAVIAESTAWRGLQRFSWSGDMAAYLSPAAADWQDPSARAPRTMSDWAGFRAWAERTVDLPGGDLRVAVSYDLGSEIHAYRTQLLRRLGVFGVIVLLGLGVAYLLSGWLNRALEQTASAVQAMPLALDVPRVRSRLLEPDMLNFALRRLGRSIQREQRRVLRQKQRLEHLVNQAPVIVWWGHLGQDQRIVMDFISTSFQKLTEHVDMPDFQAWLEFVHAADRERVRQRFDMLLSEGYASVEYRFRTNSGNYLWLYGENTLLEQTDGEPREIVGLAIDITELKQGQAQLVQSAKMATLGEMATGVAHELNQPLQVIQLAADNALETLEDKIDQRAVDYLRARLERITQQSERAASIIDHMRLFGRRREQADSDVALSTAVDGVLSLIGQQLKVNGIMVQARHAEPSAMVRGQLQYLEQVLINVLNNGRDAIRQRRAREEGEGRREFTGSLVIETAVEQGSEVREAVLRVQDNGGGIPEHVIDHIFDPFFTTKPVGQGTGLGLSISYGIVRDMGGRLECRNGSEGAVFELRFPALPG